MSLRKRIKKAWKGLTGEEESKPLYAIKKSAMHPEEMKKLADKLGATIVVVDEIDDIKRVDEKDLEGDGQAEFLGEGTEAEFLAQQREDDGTGAWYKRILRDE